MFNRKVPLVTACLRIYGRPLRTKRMMECLLKQTFTDFEVLLMADGCSRFLELTKSKWYKEWRNQMRIKRINMVATNQAEPHKDWGAHVAFMGIQIAMGKYFIFLDNDDIILPEHIDFYYHSIARHENDAEGPAMFVYNPTLIYNGGNKWIRDPQLRHGGIGHQELIVNTQFLKKMPKEQPVYDQDWLLVEHMMQHGRHLKGTIAFPTHHIMSVEGCREPGFENDL